MAITKTRHLPRIISNPPRSLQNGQTEQLRNKKVGNYNRLLASKVPKEGDKSKKAFPAPVATQAIKSKKIAGSLGKKKPLSGAEKALKATPKLPKSTDKKPALAKPKKWTPPVIKKKPKAAIVKPKLSQNPLTGKKVETPLKSPAKAGQTLATHTPKNAHHDNLSLQLHAPANKNLPNGKLSGQGVKKQNFGKLKQKAILHSATSGKQVRIHKSFLSHVKPPDKPVSPNLKSQNLKSLASKKP
ncbi:MAG: hypothetical protein M1374_04585 [Firmicutes bacterium]|jgi:hypothetical protein|nr:hypothetical protein [Bacillota bacterium]